MSLGVRDALRNYGFLVAGLLLLGLGALVISATIRFKADAGAVAHSYQVLETLNVLQRDLEKASSELRGYRLAGQASNLGAFRSAESELRQDVDRLIALVADDPAQSDLATQARKLVLQRLDLANQAIAALDTRDHGLVGIVPRSNAVQTRSNALIESMRELENSILLKRQQTSSKAFVAVVTASALGIPLSLVMMGYTYVLLGAENKDRKRAVVQLEKLTLDMGFLASYGGMLQSAATPKELFEVTQQALRGLLPGLAGRLYIIRASRDRAEIAAHWGRQGVAVDEAPAPSDCWAIRRNQPYLVEDSRRGVLCAHSRATTDLAHATACIPLSAHGEVFGWLYLCQFEPGKIEGIDLAINACEQLSMALANVNLREILRQQAIRDLLTGLFNRRYLEESLEREVSRCRRRNLPLSVLMMDLDHFKAFNDLYGHAGGDAVLGAFGRMLETMCRGEDIACRFGGEEFALVLPEAPLEAARAKAAEIREAAQKLLISHLGRELPGVTVSIGVSVMPVHGVSGTALLRAADDALYVAKRNGRNRFELAVSTSATLAPPSSAGPQLQAP